VKVQKHILSYMYGKEAETIELPLAQAIPINPRPRMNAIRGRCTLRENSAHRGLCRERFGALNLVVDFVAKVRGQEPAVFER
jgi:hypothetical protein